MSWDNDTDDHLTYQGDRKPGQWQGQLTRAERILNQLPIPQQVAMRTITENWCKWAGVPFEDWPEQHEWFGLLDMIVRQVAAMLRLQALPKELSNWASTEQACKNLGVDFERLRHRWGRNGRPW